MKPISIRCGTCAARLKVTNPSAIGQVLACPKCGNMVRVTPPPGWTPPQDPNEESSQPADVDPAQSSGDDLSASDFDDIDNLLGDATPPATGNRGNSSKAQPANKSGSSPRSKPAQPGTPAQKKKRPAAAAKNAGQAAAASSRQKTGQPAAQQSAVQPSAQQPMLPDSQWVSPESRARKKMLTIAGLILGGLLIVSGIVAAVMVNRPDPVETVAETNPEQEDPDSTGQPEPGTNPEDTDTPPGDTTDPPAQPESGSDTTPPVDDADPEETGDEDSANVQPEPPAVQPGSATTQDPSGSGTENPPGPLPNDPPPLTGDPPGTEESLQDETARNPLAILDTGDDVLSGGGILTPDTADARENELTNLLKEVGTSVLDIEDLVRSIRDVENGGVPKYYIAKVESKLPDVGRQLDLDVGSIQYQDLPVVFLLRDLASVLGLTFQVDTDSLQAAEIPFDITVNVNASNVTYGVMLDQALESIGLVKTIDPDGTIIVRAKDSSALSLATYELPPVPAGNPDARKLQLEAIRELVAPGTWGASVAGGPAMELHSQSVLVNHRPAAHRQIKLLFEKIHAARRVLNDQSKLENEPVLVSVSTSASPARTEPGQLGYSWATPIEEILNQVYKKTGVMVLVDWKSLQLEGWTPDTIVPGDFSEPTAMRAVNELAGAMRLTVRVVDAKTLELTTFEKAAARSDLEIYYCGDLFTGMIQENHLVELFNRTLGPMLNKSETVLVDYDSELKCIISRAPQPLQRQIEAIIDRLRDISGN